MEEKDILQALDIASNALRDIAQGTLYPRDIAQKALKKMKKILETESGQESNDGN